jgi:hypothetical protein
VTPGSSTSRGAGRYIRRQNHTPRVRCVRGRTTLRRLAQPQAHRQPTLSKTRLCSSLKSIAHHQSPQIINGQLRARVGGKPPSLQLSAHLPWSSLCCSQPTLRALYLSINAAWIAFCGPPASGRFVAVRRGGRRTLSQSMGHRFHVPRRRAPLTATLGSTTEAGTPPGALQDDQEVREVAPPTPGAHVTRDPEHPYMSTPVRANQVTTTTPADSAKKAGDNGGHPVNLH